jgi:hypothetical protein
VTRPRQRLEIHLQVRRGKRCGGKIRRPFQISGFRQKTVAGSGLRVCESKAKEVRFSRPAQ